MLVSFQLASRHPGNLAGFFDNLERTATDPTCFEVLVKIDTDHSQMQSVLATEVTRRKFRIRPLVTPRRRGYEDLWEALNELFKLTDHGAYFVCNVNDEVRIREQGWDGRLSHYIGLFPDHIFRLRTSQFKLHNYFDFWECGFAPEGLAFFTKRWLDICGDWGPCFGPDSSQQYIAYYLAYGNHPGIKQYNRDVPILDISWNHEGVGRNLTPSEQHRRIATNFRLWNRQVSHPMQQELYRRGRLLQAHIMQAECASICPVTIVDDRSRRAILLRDAKDGALLDLLPYKISRTGLFFRNLRRTARYTFYGGGGRPARNLLPMSVSHYLVLRYLWLRRLPTAISPFRLLRALLARLRAGLRLAARALIRAWKIVPFAVRAFRNSARRFIGACRSLRNSLSKSGLAGRVLAALLNAIADIVFQIVSGGATVISWCARGAAALAGILRRLRQAGQTKVERLKLGWLKKLLLKQPRLDVRMLRALVTSSVWWQWGNRLSLALMDRDWRWMTIKESHTKRIAAIRDPWFDASRMRTDESTIGTVAATGEADIKDPLKEHRAAAYLGSNEILLQQSDIIDVAKSADRT